MEGVVASEPEATHNAKPQNVWRCTMKERLMLTVAIIGFWLACCLWGALWALPVINLIDTHDRDGEIVIDHENMSDHEFVVEDVTVGFSDNFLCAIEVDDSEADQVAQMDEWITETIRRSIKVLGEFRSPTVVCASVEDFRSTTYAVWTHEISKPEECKVFRDQRRGVVYLIVGTAPTRVQVNGMFAVAALGGNLRGCVRPLAPVLQQAIIDVLVNEPVVNVDRFLSDPGAHVFLASPSLATVEGQFTNGIMGEQRLAVQVALSQLLRSAPQAIAILLEEYRDRGWNYEQCIRRLDQLAVANGLRRWSASYGCFAQPQQGLWAYPQYSAHGVSGDCVYVVARDSTGAIPATEMQLIDVCESHPLTPVPAGTIHAFPLPPFREHCWSADWLLFKGSIHGKGYTAAYIFSP